MKAISTIVRTIVTRNARIQEARNRSCDIDEDSLDEVFFYEPDGQAVTFREFNRSLEQEFGR